MTSRPLTRSEAVAILRRAEAEILGLGVQRLALFGSIQRDAARSDSDVDVLVEFVPGKKSFDRFAALSELLEDILGRPVELVTPESLSPFLRPYILAEAKDVVRAA
jgi:predicted nucleotidyltransferase